VATRISREVATWWLDPAGETTRVPTAMRAAGALAVWSPRVIRACGGTLAGGKVYPGSTRGVPGWRRVGHDRRGCIEAVTRRRDGGGGSGRRCFGGEGGSGGRQP
jgi:hypothetical protein